MRRLAWLAAFTLITIAPPALAQIAAGPYYARGSFYCASGLAGYPSLPDSCFGYGSVLELLDDGAHGDDLAGDGVYGGWVTSNQPAGAQEFKIANADWSFSNPTASTNPFVNGRLYVAGPGDVVHFRLDTSAPPYGWLPAVAVANDHAYPAGATLELMGSAPELGAWGTGLPATHEGTIWQRIVTIANPGNYQFKFRVQGTWSIANFGLDYNNEVGDNGTFSTYAPDTEVILQFDEHTGRIRAIDNNNVPVHTSSWGRLKAIYR
jgi:hypothetical protein